MVQGISGIGSSTATAKTQKAQTNRSEETATAAQERVKAQMERREMNRAEDEKKNENLERTKSVRQVDQMA